MIEIPKLKCNQCGHEWIPRTQDVRVCPNRRCHSIRWDKPNTEEKELNWDKPNTEEKELKRMIERARKDFTR